MRRWPILVLSLITPLGCTMKHRQLQPRTQQIVKQDGATTITDVHLRSDSLDAIFRYRIIVPAHGADEHLPVLYLLHGANSGPADLTDRSDIIRLASSERLIVVLPEADTSYYTNAKHRNHARWEDAITIDLPRDVADNFPILQGRQHTGIAGISMGGYGAVKLALKHPDLYSFAGFMSGSLDITRRRPSLRRLPQTIRIWSIFGYRESTRRGEDVFELLNRNTAAHDIKWFASCGKKDPLEPFNERFAKNLNQRGIDTALILTPGGHDWQSWNTALPRLVQAAAQSLR